MLYNKRVIRFTAKVMLLVMITQLIVPATQTFALTSGPSQPEVQSFEPVGTTDMVDMFSGDFVYNIPLMDVEGYPINISYHGGADMEQEASWVGLGWNINPGVVNRTVRGLPDDMNGETISKTLNIKDENNICAGVGAALEFMGDDHIGISAGADIAVNFSNYRGVSADIGVNAGAQVPFASAGVNLGVGSQTGAGVDLYGGLKLSTTQIVGGENGVGLGATIGSGYNSRTGLKDLNYGFSISVNTSYGSAGLGFGQATVPIATKNMIPVITNASRMNTYRGRIKLGGEAYGGYLYGNLHGSFSTVKYDHDGSRPGYGYLYAQNADNHSIMDFTRDKDGMFNKTMALLPPGNMTYDIYGVSGQGTGGSFRPYRNDFGSVFDPVTTSEEHDVSGEVEFGLGNLFEAGVDVTTGRTDITSGPWDDYQRPFTDKVAGSIYENTYFKQAGEATATNPGLMTALGGLNAMDGAASVNIPVKKPGSDNMRDARGNLIYYFTADEASKYGVASSGTSIPNYTSTNGFASGTDNIATSISRTDAGSGRKGSQLSEIVQVQTDGRKYIYGIPAMNTSQDEVTMAVNGPDNGNGQVSYTSTEASASNGSGRDHYFSKTSTPAFAHSYLLTDVLSADYVDVKGDGVTDDDFGSFTKFNYSRKNAAFGWKSPYGAGVAQFNAGFRADKQDNKANYIQGTKEEWMLHSVETKNFVAEFYTSARDDARGVNTTTDISYKLDSIKLYNKHDRLIHLANAVPIKTVMFSYNYELCPGVPNNINGGGKLTLKKIYVRYGNSDRSMISPYQFSYASNGNNYSYNYANRDRWGGYADVSGKQYPTEYPYVNQNDANLDKYAGAWSLDKITLPSGGTIQLQYEADDYAYVMDRPAMEMFNISGVGKSTNFTVGNQLYTDKDNPNLYLYFNRRTASENPNLIFKDNYLKDASLLYYNAETRIVDNAFEPIKGYAEVQSVGICGNDVSKGYIQLKPVSITGGGATLNPISYTGINFGRYYLPNIIFPGSNPDDSGLMNILAGLKYALGELVGIMKNPVKRMTQEGKAKEIGLANSYIRLNSPGLHKKGGGQRVKSITFYDHWDQLAGGNSQLATYGKTYDYTTQADNGSGTISSGVASYEPQIGGDENPFRTPVDYTVQAGSSFPPNDPVGLYQEYPIGESLYPGASVGYSKVTVKSIHQQQGRSSQGEDIYQFYTAKDFPVKTDKTLLNPITDIDEKGFFVQKQVFEASQGYTLTFNDMHGKPKRIEHRVLKPGSGTSDLVSYKEYNYFTDGGGNLSNDVPVVAYDAASGKMKKQTQTVGLEADITIDTREKKEDAQAKTYLINLNVFLIGIIPVPVPFLYYDPYDSKHEFRTVVATKVVQQYGILKEVISSDEGAVTRVQNEAFDPVTGQALITSVNNEYNDHEFSVNYPAYWGYKSMGPSYENTGYTENFSSANVSNYEGELPTGPTCSNYRVGDELLITYTYNNQTYTNNVWVMGFKQDISNYGFSNDCYYPNFLTPEQLGIWQTINIHVAGNFLGFPHPLIKPRYKYQNSWPGQTVNGNGTITNVSIKVIRSGAKNQLNESIENYTGMDQPFDGNNSLKDDLTSLINISAKVYSDSLTAILPRYDSLQNPAYWDSINEYVNGTREIKRVAKEYAYIKNRDYSGNSSRNAGLFSATGLWNNSTSTSTPYAYIDTMVWCRILRDTVTGYPVDPVTQNALHILYHITGYYPIGNLPNSSIYNSYLQPYPQNDPNWVVARTVTKYSPWGFELENMDAIGNYTAAIYGYNQQLPMALAQNARQQEILFDGFEDYNLLQVLNNLTTVNSSGFNGFFSFMQAISGSTALYQQFVTNQNSPLPKLDGTMAHTGKYSLLIPSGANVSMNFSLLASLTTAGQPKYASFAFQTGKQYVLSYWIRPTSITKMENAYTPPTGMLNKSNIIENWQQVEKVFTAGTGSNTVTFPAGSNVDDIRIYPKDANMKSFVYNPVNQKLMATLDENNFATFYEYDQEGNLVRTKKETEKGIMTVMESRSANVKAH